MRGQLEQLCKRRGVVCVVAQSDSESLPCDPALTAALAAAAAETQQVCSCLHVYCGEADTTAKQRP